MSASEDTAALLARVVGSISEGEERPGQRQMAEAVAEAIERGGHVVVRAGTGTGKTLGYLVPALASGHKVVVTTATKALQDQLAAKDLPLVAAAWPGEFSYEILKGRANYLCAQRLAESTNSQGAFDLGSQADNAAGASRHAEEVKNLMSWAQRTSTGDRAELEQEPDPIVWSAFSVDSEECPGAQRCPSGHRCFAEAARRRAEEAQITVVNSHLLGADMASEGGVLFDYDVLVVDEAHELESILSASLGRSISAGRLRSVGAIARRAASEGADGPRRQTLGAAIDALSDVADRLDRVLEGTGSERLVPPLSAEIAAVLSLLSSRLDDLARALRAGSDPSELSATTTRAIVTVGRTQETVGRLVGLSEADVAWIEGSTRRSIEIAPIDISTVCAERLFADRSVVMTSATVPLELAQHLGANASDTVSMDVGSPFDFEHQSLLYCAADLPDRRRDDAIDKLLEELEFLIAAAGGRTLALFTSWSAMRRAVEHLRDRLSFPIHAQGEQTKPTLLANFTADPASCLFATMSFWQGVDVPGATLSLVVIDRIPFPRPDDPLLVARRERIGREAFRQIDLPRAATLLAQGAGRLIRTANDRGVVAVLDSRLATASYRWDLLHALPPMRRTKDRQEVERFLRSIAEGESVA